MNWKLFLSTVTNDQNPNQKTAMQISNSCTSETDTLLLLLVKGLCNNIIKKHFCNDFVESSFLHGWTQQKIKAVHMMLQY